MEALKIRHELIDYNTCSLYDEAEGPILGVDGYEEDHTVNIESLYARSWMSNGIGSLMYSPAMENIIDKDHDLRYKLFIGTLDGMYFNTLFARMNYSGIQVSEVWLTKAEAALRKSQPDIPEAIEALDYVRQHRYDNFQTTTLTDKKQLLTEILNERRREIIFNEMSFLDRKRQNADPETARPMTRTVFGKTYTLPVGDPHYQLPIPLNVMNMNKLLIQNER
ncbi:RagB/SusD family nutrient uptake outer membrane protein [Odoribacter splanchnicus]|mgnify:FL=1|uniref:RagB/SusD family nutrient uptake outer membrane protein n=1 Tax=Odoribacter splanchnicus TaxID=28118 RepID=A0AAW6FLJ3_9BACT|nr:RagB/SusD family nutrient uptake outer membrane protein [Odoribacter splanchnicus]MDB9208469.1 RagB/SusD family nutrient uptake outer membrane protein [Odoribacter splanchnicus]MDB9215910.1 RagB/SusD family nutrient uptake outer membrane protein [Odoribacter splanchnicus]MDB9224042.1 RagB/SusD family nutrient uptake outer membrane protein [Odoribacter splanchnicus]